MDRWPAQTAAGEEASWARVPGFWFTIGERDTQVRRLGDGFADAHLVEHGAGAFTVWFARRRNRRRADPRRRR